MQRAEGKMWRKVGRKREGGGGRDEAGGESGHSKGRESRQWVGDHFSSFSSSKRFLRCRRVAVERGILKMVPALQTVRDGQKVAA